MEYIVVTGGLGFIGSHTVVELINRTPYAVVILDNLSNSRESRLHAIRQLVHRPDDIHLIIGDAGDAQTLELIFQTYSVTGVIHFAALKSVEESVQHPLHYYDHNIAGTLTLLRIMERFHIYRFVFSSSATVYGTQNTSPLREDMKVDIDHLANPYGKSKAIVEKILADLTTWNITILRYFNPIGSHPSGTLKEDPLQIPKNIFPLLRRVAENQQSHFSVYGADYPTKDGTAIRDYIHVVDLARAHVMVLAQEGHHTYNVGTGKGSTVLDLIYAYEKIHHTRIPILFKNPREGDLSISFCDVTKIREEVGWTCDYELEDMCR